MIIIGITYGALTGNISSITDGAIEAGGEAISLCITMAGVISMWTGLMAISKKCGIIDALTNKMTPLMAWLFPDIPKNCKAMEYMSTNMIANFLGLGWAATPSALLAMKELKKYNNDSTTASNAMCCFLVINISSIQLIPINIIAYRAQYGSIDPAAIIFPAIIATTVSTLVAVIYCKLKYRKDAKHESNTNHI